jgi:cytochrome d ubiquinol oxidase subunit II
MGETWFWIVTSVVAAYVVLDGFDLGAGVLHPFLGRSERDRRDLLAAIGPVWDGNEVFLIAAGATLFLSFPPLYASAFSGFYLPLMIVLWLLIGRAIAIEFRNHVEAALWRDFWDRIFFVSSLLLVAAFGAALGNVVRGVSLDRDGRFFAPLWTDFTTTGRVGLLDWYTTLVACLAVAALALHGAVWLAVKTRASLRERCLRAARLAWWPTLALTVGVTIATFRVQPQVPRQLREAPWGAVFPVLALGGLLGVRVLVDRGRDALAFAASSTFVAGMIGSAAFGIHPYVLPSNEDPSLGLTIERTAGDPQGLATALGWWIPGMLLSAGWVAFVYRRFRGRVGGEPAGEPPREAVP